MFVWTSKGQKSVITCSNTRMVMIHTTNKETYFYNNKFKGSCLFPFKNLILKSSRTVSVKISNDLKGLSSLLLHCVHTTICSTQIAWAAHSFSYLHAYKTFHKVANKAYSCPSQIPSQNRSWKDKHMCFPCMNSSLSFYFTYIKTSSETIKKTQNMTLTL